MPQGTGASPASGATGPSSPAQPAATQPALSPSTSAGAGQAAGAGTSPAKGANTPTKGSGTTEPSTARQSTVAPTTEDLQDAQSAKAKRAAERLAQYEKVLATLSSKERDWNPTIALFNTGSDMDKPRDSLSILLGSYTDAPRPDLLSILYKQF